MSLIREPEKQEMGHISHRLSATAVKRYRAQVKRGKKMRVNVPASSAKYFQSWLDEVEVELKSIKASQLHTAHLKLVPHNRKQQS